MSKTKEICIPINVDLFNQLIDQLRREGGTGHDFIQVIEELISRRVDASEVVEEQTPPEGELEYSRIQKCDEYSTTPHYFSNIGYQWDKIFLPHGTLLRMKNRSVRAAICNEEIVLVNGKDEGEDIGNPTAFAKYSAGGESSRSAKRDIQIRRPHDEQWYSYDQVHGLQQAVESWAKVQRDIKWVS